MVATRDRALADLLALEAAPGLLVEEALGERLDAIEQLSFIGHLLRAGGGDLAAYQARAAALSERLEGINRHLYARLRERLLAAPIDRAEVRTILARYSRYGADDGPELHLDYEPADALVDGVLQIESFSGAATVKHPELVHLEDTPVRVLLDLVDHVPLHDGDWLCDLGSGLGRAAIILAWLTGAPVRGIEIQPAYCAFSRELADAFGLTRVTFEQADARHADLSAGTVFYLFTPFRGRTLRMVLDRLHAEAKRRPITLCTYGSVSLVAARESWLSATTLAQPHEYSLGVWRSVGD